MSVVISGGSRGIGATLVKRFAAAGWNVAFTYVSRRESANAVIEECRAASPEATVRAYQLDLRDPDAIDRFAEQAIDDFGDVRAVVNNAATIEDGPAVTMTNECWTKVIDANLSGPFYLTRAFLMHFLSNRSGRIVFISSLAQYGSSGQANYAAAKAGLNGLSQTLAKEYGRKGITSNIVTVGLVPTDMAGEGVPEASKRFWLDHCPAGRMGTADDIAGAVLYLCGDEASFITGENLRVAGGLTYAP